MTLNTLRYRKREGILLTVKDGNKSIPAMAILVTYKFYPLDLFHRELVITLRYRNANYDIFMDDETIITYYLI